MIKLITLTALLAISALSYGQTNCAPSINCSSYAVAGTYKILNNPGEQGSEVILAPGINDAALTCDLLCEIEQKRKPHQDVIIWFEGVQVLIYAADGSTMKIEEEDE